MDSLPKLKTLSDIRWYVYRSAPKINMLFDQMFSNAATSTKKSLSVSAKIVSGIYESSVEAKETLDDRLTHVEKELEGRGLIGTLDEPGEFVRGSMRMRFGMFDDNGFRPSDSAPLVYFGGFDRADVPLVVGLGGSSANLERMNGMSNTGGRSYTDVITRWLLAGDEDDGAPGLPQEWDMRAETHRVFDAMTIALKYLRRPTQDLRFLARVLKVGTHASGSVEMNTGENRARFILGTPIYVTYESPFEEDNGWGLDSDWDRPVTKNE